MIREYFDTKAGVWVVTDGKRRIEYTHRNPYLSLDALWEQPHLHGGRVVNK